MWKQRLQDLQLAITLAAVVGKLKMADILITQHQRTVHSAVLGTYKPEVGASTIAAASSCQLVHKVER